MTYNTKLIILYYNQSVTSHAFLLFCIDDQCTQKRVLVQLVVVSFLGGHFPKGNFSSFLGPKPIFNAFSVGRFWP